MRERKKIEKRHKIRHLHFSINSIQIMVIVLVKLVALT